MDVPFVLRCFGILPPACATCVISCYGMIFGFAGLGVTGAYAVLRHTPMLEDKVDENAIKAVILNVGLISILLVTANAALCLGILCRARGAVGFGVWVLLGMCAFIIVISVMSPVACYFILEACAVQELPAYGIALLYMGLCIFVSMWLYFAIVARNHMDRGDDEELKL